MGKTSFKIRILIYCIIAAFIPLLISWIPIYFKIEKRLLRDSEKLNHAYLNNYIDKVEMAFVQKEDIVKSIARAYPYTDQRNFSIEAFLSEQLKMNPYFLNLYIVDGRGDVYVGDKKRRPSVDGIPWHSYGSEANQKELAWTEPYRDEISGQSCIGVSIPLINGQGHLDGVLAGSISADFIKNLIKEDKLIGEADAFLINASGYIKYDAMEQHKESVHIKDSDFVLSKASDKIMGTKSGCDALASRDGRWIYSFSSINSNGWKIVSLLNSSKLTGEANRINVEMTRSLYAFGIVNVIFALIGAVILSRTISKPLMQLRDGVRAISAENLESRIVVAGTDEFKEVADAFNELSYKLRNYYNDLISRTDEVYKKNSLLQTVNLELQASYQQLGAAMDQLNQSEEKYRSLMSNISDMVVAVNTKGTIVYVNAKVEKLLGYRDSALIGRHIEILTGQSTTTLKMLFEEDYSIFQTEMIRVDGSSIIVEGSSIRIIEEGQVTGIQAIVRDITQRKQMESTLQRRYNELQVLNKISKVLTSTIDLESLLNIVVKQVVNVADALVCSIRLIEGKNQSHLMLKAIYGVKIEKISRSDIGIQKEVVDWVMQSKNTIDIELTESNLPSEYFKVLYYEENARHVIFNPLVAQGKSIGVMTTTSRNKPSEEQIDLLNSLANNAAIAIDNASAYENLKQSYLKTVQTLVSVVEAKDVYTESHSIRVAKYASFIAEEMGLPKECIEDIWVAGVLHDIGKIGISDNILNKTGPLCQEEYEVVKQHPYIAYKILNKIGLKDEIIYAIRHHHERYDGAGYPDRLPGSSMPLMSSIISVADSFDAITSRRSYKEAKTLREGIDELIACKGTQFNPEVVEAFVAAYTTKSAVLNQIYCNIDIEFF